MSLETLRCAQIISNEVSAVTFDESAANELTTYNLNEVIFAKIVVYQIITLYFANAFEK